MDVPSVLRVSLYQFNGDMVAGDDSYGGVMASKLMFFVRLSMAFLVLLADPAKATGGDGGGDGDGGFDPEPSAQCRCEVKCTFIVPPSDPDDVFKLGCRRIPISVNCGDRGNVADSLASPNNNHSIEGCELVNCTDFSGSADPFSGC